MRLNIYQSFIVILSVLALSERTYAQKAGATPEETQLLKLKTFDASLVLEAEQRHEKTTARDGSRSLTEDSLRLWPLLNINTSGSIFHPNLLEFSFDGDFGLSWENGEYRAVESPSSDITTQRDSTTALRRYDAQLLLLKEKNYPIVFSAGRAVARRDYDFFRRVTVDTEHYGVNWSLKSKEWPLSLALSHRVEDMEDIERPETDENNRVLLTLRNQRSTYDLTDARYTLDQYRYLKGYAPEQHGINHSVQVLDVQTFGNTATNATNGSSLRTRLDFNDRNSIFMASTNSATQQPQTTNNSTRVALMEELKIRHSESLSSIYNYDFSDNRTEKINNTQHKASIGLRHQLYESLTSMADIHGRTTGNSGADSNNKTEMAGAGVSEAYVKKLGTWGHFTLGGSAGLDFERRDSSGGAVSIINEGYNFAAGRLTVLKNPEVSSSSIVVTDSGGTTRYVEGVDYSVVSHGKLTEIRRMAGGHIASGDTVLVDYNSAGQASDRFSTALNSISFRFDFADNLIGLYGRHNGVNHSGGEALLLEEINNNVIGFDVKVERFRTGVEYQTMDSNLLPYNSMHSFQQYNFVPFSDCTLGLDMDQTVIVYKDTDEKQNTYSYIGSGRFRLMSNCSIDIQGGLRQEHGPILNRDTYLMRSELELTIGQMSIRIGYELQDEKDSTEDRAKTLAYFKATRQF